MPEMYPPRAIALTKIEPLVLIKIAPLFPVGGKTGCCGQLDLDSGLMMG